MCIRDRHIRSGETIGIIGSTGSAKSSLVQLIPRLYDVSEGTVKVGGKDVRDYDLTTLRDSVAMVLQKNVLFSGTIAENIRWGDKNATDEEVKHVCMLAKADEFIDKMPDGYNTYIEQGGTNVSGGQKQRLCIARALLKKPKILIMDDSTSAVDTKTDALIRKAMKEYIPSTTKIIIAQRTSSVGMQTVSLLWTTARSMRLVRVKSFFVRMKSIVKFISHRINRGMKKNPPLKRRRCSHEKACRKRNCKASSEDAV